MQSEKDINSKILEITMLIQNKYPELSKYLIEMPVTIPIDKNPKINSEYLQKYYDSLDQLLKKYILEHPNTHPLL
ncbi:hypothetical protein [Flavobacterium psychrotolerans]|uniref:Uncharacterized protein n=1 Tax=Flavobacterium psychrotolerans TaxID=2169410 RepID=A0A2U1JIE0_9FLAO|nr:hypothetical protein [Flavobacterium psychrotolerans]PWA04785.1 hypothetical protein DB895_09880 [Flavobacterium psychrotolerans]